MILPLTAPTSETGDQKAVIDLAWPTGLQPENSQPLAVLLNETADVLAVAQCRWLPLLHVH